MFLWNSILQRCQPKTSFNAVSRTQIENTTCILHATQGVCLQNLQFNGPQVLPSTDKKPPEKLQTNSAFITQRQETVEWEHDQKLPFWAPGKTHIPKTCLMFPRTCKHESFGEKILSDHNWSVAITEIYLGWTAHTFVTLLPSQHETWPTYIHLISLILPQQRMSNMYTPAHTPMSMRNPLHFERLPAKKHIKSNNQVSAGLKHSPDFSPDDILLLSCSMHVSCWFLLLSHSTNQQHQHMICMQQVLWIDRRW